MKEVSENEFWVYHGILIAASLFRRGGMGLWPTPSDTMKTMWTKPDFSQYMTTDRFKVLKRFNLAVCWHWHVPPRPQHYPRSSPRRRCHRAFESWLAVPVTASPHSSTVPDIFVVVVVVVVVAVVVVIIVTSVEKLLK